MPDEGVGPRATIEYIVAFATDKNVIAGIAIQGVVTGFAFQMVVAAVAGQRVGAAVTEDNVVIAGTIERPAATDRCRCGIGRVANFDDQIRSVAVAIRLAQGVGEGFALADIVQVGRRGIGVSSIGGDRQVAL